MNNAERTIENNPAIGRSWDEVEAELFTLEEIAESDRRVALIGELIKARQELERNKMGSEVERQDARKAMAYDLNRLFQQVFDEKICQKIAEIIDQYLDTEN